MPVIVPGGGSGQGTGNRGGASGGSSGTVPGPAGGVNLPQPGGKGVPTIAPGPRNQAQGTTQATGAGMPPGGGGGGGGGSGPGGLIGPLFPTFAKPSWLIWPMKSANDLASNVRNGFFAMLGDLSQYPYSTGKLFTAYLRPLLQSGNQDIPSVPLPIQFVITIYDSAGNVVGTVSTTENQADQLFLVQGVFVATSYYTVGAVLTLSDGSVAQWTSPPVLGSALTNMGSPYSPQITITLSLATTSGKVTLLNADGTPYVGAYLIISIDQPGSDTTTPTPIVNMQEQTDANGDASFAGSLSALSGNGEYVLTVVAFSDSEYTNQIAGYTSGSLTVDELNNLTATLTVGQGVAGQSSTTHGPPPPHHGRSP